MLKGYWLQFCLLALAVIAIPLGSLAQQAHSEGKRKMTVEIRAVYPRLGAQSEPQWYCAAASYDLARRLLGPHGATRWQSFIGEGSHGRCFQGQMGADACGDYGNRANQI